jgi:glycosyltransferase involved in cell wall biosynthesis
LIKRIIWHGNAPWVGSGYGEQTALFVPLIKALGYEIIISTFSGLQGAPLDWNGMVVLPATQDAYGADGIPAHAHHGGADVVIALMDAWALNAELVKSAPLACWMPVDVGRRDPAGSSEILPGLGDADVNFLTASGAVPIAMSRWGEAALAHAGFEPLYVPHGVDTTVFTPRADRDELRERLGLTGKFVFIMIAANKDAIRKSFFPQLEAFGRFRRKYCPEAVLLIHSLIANSGGLDLQRMAQETGIDDAVIFSSQYKTLMGLFKPADIAALINQADVGTNTAMGEGFGITQLEMLACGVPCVTTRGSAMTEIALSHDWCAEGDAFWNPTHSARWVTPFISSIVDRYAYAYEQLTGSGAAGVRQQARQRALRYDASAITDRYWRPALAELDRRLMDRQRKTDEQQRTGGAEDQQSA